MNPAIAPASVGEPARNQVANSVAVELVGKVSNAVGMGADVGQPRLRTDRNRWQLDPPGRVMLDQLAQADRDLNQGLITAHHWKHR
jgi:hypothetical protein